MCTFLFMFQITMNISRKSISTKETKSNNTNRAKNLNPDAEEFIPYSLRSSGSTSIADVTERFDAGKTSGKYTLSNDSDEEAHQYWRHQLPDDITPDFKDMKVDDLEGSRSLSVGFPIHDGSEISRMSGNSQILSKGKELSSHGIGRNNSIEKIGLSFSSYKEDQTPAGFVNLANNHQNQRFLDRNQALNTGNEGLKYNGNSSTGLFTDMLSEQAILDNKEINTMVFLASQYPSFAAENLAKLYHANGCDLNSTINMLSQLKLQNDGDFNHNLNTKAVSAPKLSALDFPAISMPNGQNGLSKYGGDDLQQTSNPFRAADKESILFNSHPSALSRGAIKFPSAVGKLASQDSGKPKYEGNGSGVPSVGSSNSQILASPYSNGNGRSVYTDRSQNHGSSVQAAPFLLKSEKALANMYSERREEARDQVRLHNAWLEQARQAYLIGNKALAKESSVKEQLHNMYLRAAHGKAQEAINLQRNPVEVELKGYGKEQDHIIDLQGLQVSEAIHILRHEISVLRRVARSTGQRLQVYISVGTGHHTKGSFTPGRLPFAIEGYLLQEEGLPYTEPQPGLLRVVIH